MNFIERQSIIDTAYIKAYYSKPSDSNVIDIASEHQVEDETGPGNRHMVNIQNYFRMDVLTNTGITLDKYLQMNTFEMTSIIDSINIHSEYVLSELKKKGLDK